ncbi:MAG: hypothetical protein H6646_00355 [Anaerolineales bacterium]|nr:hypothetical protein [Anaerolineales bacterium]
MVDRTAAVVAVAIVVDDKRRRLQGVAVQWSTAPRSQSAGGTPLPSCGRVRFSWSTTTAHWAAGMLSTAGLL